MTLIPMRTVSSQVASELLENIAKGSWKEWLPSERELCQQLQVSRSTLRAALRHLQKDGVLAANHGVGHRILAGSTTRSRQVSHSVAMLAPETISHMRPNTAHWIEELKGQLHSLGYELRYHNNRNCYQAGAERALKRLLQRENHAVWILVLSNKTMQEWFVEKKIPCVVAGSHFEGVALPSVDFDFRAICRHAVGVLVGAGHKRLAFLTHKPRTAGDLESERGFHEGLKKSGRDDIEGTVAHHDESVEGIVNVVRRLMDRAERPTGLIVSNSNLLLTTITFLARRGLRVPEDISVICKDDALFLSHIVPEPARYVSDASAVAKKILTLVLHQTQSPGRDSGDVRLFPRLHKGASIGPPPKEIKSKK